jgi:pimeloyl-ACP methyl ester carboxylesterase
LPQFTTEIDGLDIHFIHVRSKHKGALPVIVSHGWPGSILEQIKLVGPLTDPTAFGGRAEDAFDVVIPSIPGYGFSGKPTATGWDHARMARAWIVLMRRLGYTRYVAQGGDVGGQITDAMAIEAPAELVAIHTNFLFALSQDTANAIQGGGPLRWSDVDWKGGTIRVSKPRVMGHDKDTTKTAVVRDVELCPRAITVLKRQRALTGLRGEHVFGHDTGEP